VEPGEAAQAIEEGLAGVEAAASDVVGHWWRATADECGDRLRQPAGCQRDCVNFRSVGKLAAQAIAEELSKPPEDLAPLKAEQAKLEKRKARVVSLLTGEESNEDLLVGLKDELKSVQGRLNELHRHLSVAEAQRLASNHGIFSR
jgi:hypothetical protein